jgi:hypothetical protein
VRIPLSQWDSVKSNDVDTPLLHPPVVLSEILAGENTQEEFLDEDLPRVPVYPEETPKTYMLTDRPDRYTDQRSGCTERGFWPRGLGIA